jgi:LCP family protein required for cell wall assembly
MSRQSYPDDTGWNQPRRPRRSPPRPSRRPHHSLRQRIAAWTSTVMVSVLVAGALVAYAKYRADWDSIQRVNVEGLIGKQPPKLNNAENILVLGSDTRLHQHGIGGTVAGAPGARSDTLMLLHISPGHHDVTVMSVPRETVVPVIGCKPSHGAEGQTAEPGQVQLINAALNNGGPACTWKTFEHVTDIHVDHFIELDFTGFEKIIDDIGGVKVCLPFAVDDSMSGLNLGKGPQHITGAQALAFWRTREDLGFGSDTQRIQRDQFLMAAIVQGIEHSGLLNSPSKIPGIISDAADAMTTDTGLDQNAMLQIAESMRGLTSKSVQFVTSPNVPWPSNQNDIEFQEPQAHELFEAIAHDNAVPKASKKPAKGKSKKPSTSVVAATTTPSKVNVSVLNGTSIGQLAATTGTGLTGRGFKVVGTGDATRSDYTKSVIEYATAADVPAANTLAGQFSDVELEQDSSLTPGTLTLIIGSTFTGLSTPHPASSGSAQPSIASIAAADQGIKGDTNICNDQAAFAGPSG